jgi:hypothetical protein
VNGEVARGVYGSDDLGGYERLRRSALGQSTDALGEPGLALLMRRGLRAWIEARGDDVTTNPTAPAPSTNCTLAADVRSELTHLVATMALGVARQEARA